MLFYDGGVKPAREVHDAMFTCRNLSKQNTWVNDIESTCMQLLPVLVVDPSTVGFVGVSTRRTRVGTPQVTHLEWSERIQSPEQISAVFFLLDCNFDKSEALNVKSIISESHVNAAVRLNWMSSVLISSYNEIISTEYEQINGSSLHFLLMTCIDWHALMTVDATLALCPFCVSSYQWLCWLFLFFFPLSLFFCTGWHSH